MNIWRLLEQFSLEGGGASNLPFDAVLYGDRAIEFRERKAPSVADYAVSPNEINIEEDSEQLCTTVIVRFLGSDGKERSTVVRNQRAIDAWNYEIEKVETTNLTTLGAARRTASRSWCRWQQSPIRSVVACSTEDADLHALASHGASTTCERWAAGECPGSCRR